MGGKHRESTENSPLLSYIQFRFEKHDGSDFLPCNPRVRDYTGKPTGAVVPSFHLPWASAMHRPLPLMPRHPTQRLAAVPTINIKSSSAVTSWAAPAQQPPVATCGHPTGPVLHESASPLCNKIPQAAYLCKRKGVYFATRFWGFKPKIRWPQGFGLGEGCRMTMLERGWRKDHGARKAWPRLGLF